MSRLRELVREIHRRSLWQVVAVYVAGSWVALQVVREMTLTLGLPDWVPPSALALLVVGFPVVMATAVVQEGGPGTRDGRGSDAPPRDRRPAAPGDGPRVDASGGSTRRGGEDGSLRSWLTWRNSLLAGVLAFAVWGLAAAGWLLLGGEPAPAAASRPGIRSLAVLPLDDFTGAEDQQHVVAGMHEAIVSALYRVSGLSVTSRTSVMQYRGSRKPVPQIARELNDVDAVVEGSVFKAGDSLRITVQLIDAASDRHLWSGEYRGDLSRILQLQSEVARAIAGEIGGTLSPEEARRLTGGSVLDREAVELYLEGRSVFLGGRPPENLARSIRLYERALEIEPGYALAWAGLADAFLVYAHIGMDPRDAFPRAAEAARRALAVDDELAEAHVALADARFHHDWAWEAAERGFRRALEISPSYATAHWWYSGLLAALGRLDEAAREITRARELDPRAPQNHEFAVRLLYYAGRDEEALAAWRGMQERGMEAPLGAWSALALHRSGRTEEALALVETGGRQGASPYVTAALAQILAEAGRRGEARDLLERLEASYRDGRMYVPHLLAIVAASLHETEAALDWLEEAARIRDGALPWAGVEPAFRPLRSEPRFRALLERMRLPTGSPALSHPAGRPAGPPSPPAIARLPPAVAPAGAGGRWCPRRPRSPPRSPPRGGPRPAG